MEGKVKLDLIEQHVIDFVRKLRADKKLRQEDIAYIIGVKASFIGNVENIGNPAKYNLKHINVFADHFGLSPKDFLPTSALIEKNGAFPGVTEDEDMEQTADELVEKDGREEKQKKREKR